MRDPATRVDPDVEAAIEETCRFLEHYMQSEYWKADPDGRASDTRVAMDEVAESNLPDWAKNFALLALHEKTKKRRGKPTREHRNRAIRMAAVRLVARGHMLTRNDETRHRASASSIVHQALRRLGEKMMEKQINTIVLKYPMSPGVLKYLADKTGMK